MESRVGFSQADDPAYAHELDVLAGLSRRFLAAHEAGDFDQMLFLCGMLVVQHATIYKLSSPVGVFDLATLFEREVPDG